MAGKVWVVLQQRDGGLHPMSAEAIAAGVQLASAVGSEAEAILLCGDPGTAAEAAAAHGPAAVRVIQHENLASYTPGGFVGALTAAAAQEAPGWIVLPHSYQSVEYMPRLAQRIDAALVPEVVSFRSADGGIVWKRPVFTGKLESEVRVKGEGPVVVSVQSGAFPAERTDAAAPVSALEVDGAAIVPDREILGVEEVAGEQVDLTQAPVILAVGRGIGGTDNMDKVEALAAALGAEIGASRPVIDSGWLPRDRQIGSSGQTVAPKLYVAAGISGAIQHLVGMKGSRCVVAINKDASAPIFGVSQYGIVGDLNEVLPALTEAIVEAKS
jgi:electron transfer flavoprotein alpha subunit